jgi:hypothetical protein
LAIECALASACVLGIFGLHEVAQALEREEQDVGSQRGNPTLHPASAARLQAAWERAEMAKAELASGYSHLNAQALITFNSALDAMVEEWVPAMRRIAVGLLVDERIKQALEQLPEAAQRLSAELRKSIYDAAIEVIGEDLPRLPRMSGSGAERYERLLRATGLTAPHDRTIPTDLDESLAELGALRDVLVHRAGRMDTRALAQAPSLRYRDGEFVRVTQQEFKTYSAAVRCYAAEILFRSVRNWPEATDNDGPRLDHWRDYARMGP